MSHHAATHLRDAGHASDDGGAVTTPAPDTRARRAADRGRSWKVASNHYAAELCGLSCAPLLLPLFPNLKEVSESFAAFAAVRSHLPEFRTSDRDVTVVAVGDGTTPRTGATFALRTRWRAVSIDPRLRPRRIARHIDRLEWIPERIEATCTKADRAIVVAVHSHADLGAAVRSVDARVVAVVAIPCCVRQVLDHAPDIEFDDAACLSPHRRVLVWRRVSATTTRGAS